MDFSMETDHKITYKFCMKDVLYVSNVAMMRHEIRNYFHENTSVDSEVV
jgi:hypothetical protein